MLCEYLIIGGKMFLKSVSKWYVNKILPGDAYKVQRTLLVEHILTNSKSYPPIATPEITKTIAELPGSVKVGMAAKIGDIDRNANDLIDPASKIKPIYNYLKWPTLLSGIGMVIRPSFLSFVQPNLPPSGDGVFLVRFAGSMLAATGLLLIVICSIETVAKTVTTFRKIMESAIDDAKLKEMGDFQMELNLERISISDLIKKL